MERKTARATPPKTIRTQKSRCEKTCRQYHHDCFSGVFYPSVDDSVNCDKAVAEQLQMNKKFLCETIFWFCLPLSCKRLIVKEVPLPWPFLQHWQVPQLWALQDLLPFLELAEEEAVTLVAEVTAVEDLTHVEDGDGLFKTMMCLMN